MEIKKKATVFEFTSYEFEPEKKRVVFHYATKFSRGETMHFTEAILLPNIPELKHISQNLITKTLEDLHLALGISYYKFYCATKVSLPYQLSKSEADFWNTVYKKGLGEFWYQNKLNPKQAPVFPYKKNITRVPEILPKNEKYLVGIGGGKDSIVALELLKEQGFDVTSFYIKTNPKSSLVQNVITKSNTKSIILERHLDWQVHQAHQYNGHVPVSAIYAFLGNLTAVLYDYNYIVVGNEYSSNFGNTHYQGLLINHQWSKSFEFETLFQNYVRARITPSITYFSLLRNFYEIRIVQLFTKYPNYFPYFSSCNVNFQFKKEDETLWCGKCPKCVFAFILLSAFLKKENLLAIFGKNLYQDESLLSLFNDVLGFGTIKPFDCVGTFDEAQSAVHMARDAYKDDFIMRQIGSKVVYHPEVFLTQSQHAIPPQCIFSGADKVALIGYGKEGIVSEQYLKQYHPKLTIGILDAKQGSDYLMAQKTYDVAIKSPGVNQKLITIPYTTATNLFFSQMQGKHTIIGVTGSKGKSTTSTLIYELLKTAGKPVMLLGNIGKPMLEVLLTTISQETIFVLELSSYQLDDCQFSPDIAVLTNLFPEHIDFHGSLKKYYEAKKRIIQFQTKENYFIYHRKASTWLKNYPGKAILIGNKKYQSNLLGKHNQSNINAAVAVAKIFNISESDIQKTLTEFRGLRHRLEQIGTYQGITFYDDAISTTPDSTIEALEALKKVDTIFLGGQDRGYHFSKLEKAIRKYKVKNIVFFPDNGEKMIKNKKGFNILKTTSMEEAVIFAYQHTKPGAICLLSCASPSYSLWKNFEEKGDSFKAFIEKYKTHEISS